jgi:flagellar hook-associated protein 3 FlgL
MRLSTAMFNDAVVSEMLKDQSALAKTQSQMSTGKMVNTAADNPTAAVGILTLSNTNAQLQQYIANGQSANTRLSLQEQALSDATTSMQSIRDLVVQANSGTNSPSAYRAIATQIQQLEDQLQGIANRQDAQGDFLFSGFSTGSQPFVRGTTGSMQYVGDSGSRTIQLDATTSIQLGDPGSAIFMGVPTGNGTFTTSAGAGNAGTAVVDPGSVTDRNAWVAGQYTISFTDSTHWQVADGAGAPVTDANGQPVRGVYNGSSGTVGFNGIQVGLSGSPAAGDTFAVNPAGREGVFDTLDRIVTTLNGAGNGVGWRAKLSSALGGTLKQLDQGSEQVVTATSNAGARLSLISGMHTTLNARSSAVSTQISQLGDVDYVKATAMYSQQYLALQAAQASFAQLGQLSLFKYL